MTPRNQVDRLPVLMHSQDEPTPREREIDEYLAAFGPLEGPDLTDVFFHEDGEER